MKRLLVSLYDHSKTATEVMQRLHDNGLDPTEIDCIESPPGRDELYLRPLFADGRGQKLHARSASRALANMGIPEDDAGDYVDAIRSGRSLVVARCNEQVAATARQIMDRPPSVDVADSEIPITEAAAGSTAGRGDESIATPSEDDSRDAKRPSDTDILKRLADQYGDDEWLQSDEPTRPPRKSLEGLPVDDRPGPYARHEADFQRHYREHIGPETHYSFGECATAYRFGLALGIQLADETDWASVEPEAARQWNTTHNPPWEAIRDAVRFGWAAGRGQKQQYRSRPRQP